MTATIQILDRHKISSILRPLLQKYGADRALLFGSYARQEATTESDIDVLVYGGPGFQPTDIFAVAEELHQQTGKAVDVYEIREINQDSPFYRSILAEGVLIA